MIGKKIVVNDYKLTYGQETVYVNVYGAFKSNKNGNKYIIYSYDNIKLYWGSLFIRNNELVVIISKEDSSEIVKKFILEVINGKLSDDFDIISLDNIQSIQIIDEMLCVFDVDMNKLYDATIPKVEVIKEEVKEKKRISIANVFFVLFILVVAAFFFVNPEVIYGKNQKYICNKTYVHDKLPADINEEIELIFTSKDVINSIKITTECKFNDPEYYSEFSNKGYVYQYFDDADSYNQNDDNYTYRLFSSIDTKSDYFMPTGRDELISYYKDNGYDCRAVDIE